MTSSSTNASKKNNKSINLPQLVNKAGFWQTMALILFALIIFTQVFNISITPKSTTSTSPKSTTQTNVKNTSAQTPKIDTAAIAQVVVPKEGITLPISWGTLGKQMIADGVIDENKFRALFEGGLTNQDEQIFTGEVNQPIVITQDNSRFILDMLGPLA